MSWDAFEENAEQLMRHTAVYWAYASRDEYGTDTFASAVNITCLINKKREEVTTKENEKMVSETRIHTSTNISIGDYVWTGGGIADLTDAEKADPTLVDTAYIVISKKEYLDDDGNVMFVKVWL